MRTLPYSRNHLFLNAVIFAALSFVSTLTTHASWETDYGSLLKKYANSSGVKYLAWSKNSADQSKLSSVLKEMARIDATKLNKNDRAAFRINLYNASMLKVALDHYPLKSVTKIGFIPFSVFKKKHVSTPQGAISLNTLEKKQLLVDFPDARVHFAVNCASRSCPPLRYELYRGKSLNSQLNAQATQFADTSYAVRIEGKNAYYSELFKWYIKDFHDKSAFDILNQYRTHKIPKNLHVKWQKYDWSLNSSQ